MEDNLQQSFQQIVNDFGPYIINDKNLANIVADYYSFDRNPAVRNILKAIVSDGYAIKISQLKTSKGNPSIDLERYANEIEQSWGYSKEQVREVLSCIASCIGIVSKIDNSTNQNQQPRFPPYKISQKHNNPNIIHNQTTQNNNQPINSIPRSYKYKWLNKVKIWQLCIVWLVLFTIVGGQIGFIFSTDNGPSVYYPQIPLLFGFFWFIFGVSGWLINKHILLNKNVANVALWITFIVGLLAGVVGGCSLNTFDKKEIDRIVSERDTLALSNYINKNRHYDALDYYERKKISDKYDSLKYVMMGCEKIIDDMSAHTKVLNSYGFSDTSLKNMYSENFYAIISSLLNYQPCELQQNREYMIDKLIAYLNYNEYPYRYPWKDKSYNNWNRFDFIDSNNVLIKCEGFQIRLTKEKEVWYVDDYIKEDESSLKEIYSHYIQGY